MGHWVLLWELAFLTKEQGLIPSFCKLKKICVKKKKKSVCW